MMEVDEPCQMSPYFPWDYTIVNACLVLFPDNLLWWRKFGISYCNFNLPWCAGQSEHSIVYEWVLMELAN